MKWLLAICSLMWLFVYVGSKRGDPVHDHACTMGMLTLIGYAILDRLDGMRK